MIDSTVRHTSYGVHHGQLQVRQKFEKIMRMMMMVDFMYRGQLEVITHFMWTMDSLSTERGKL